MHRKREEYTKTCLKKINTKWKASYSLDKLKTWLTTRLPWPPEVKSYQDRTSSSNASTLAASPTPTKAKKEQSLRAENVLSQRTNSVGHWRTEMILLRANWVSQNVFPALRIHHWENCWVSSVPPGICQKRQTPRAGTVSSWRRGTSTRIREVN